MKRVALIVTLIGLLALALSACAQQSQAPAQPAQKPAEAPKTEPKAVAPAAPTTAPAAPAAPAAPTAAAAAKPAAPQRGGGVIDASFAEAVSLNPLLTNDSASTTYQALVWADPLSLDPNTLDIIGHMYDGKPQVSADGKTLTAKLKDGLKWSDGKPITAKDVEFTWSKIVDEKTKVPARSFYTNSFTDVKAPDDKTVVYTLKEAGFCPAILNSDIPVLPQHVYEKLDINQNDENNKPTVTSGMFKVKEWVKDSNATFSPAYEGYVRGQPLLDSYTYRILKDNTVQTQAFKTQEVDFAYPDPVDWDEISKLPHAQTFRYMPPGASWTYIGYNLKHPLLADKKVRQAIAHAVPVKDMIDKIRLGFAKPQYANIPASSFAYTDDVPKFDYNPDKAKQMIKEAGYQLQGKNLLGKDGQPVKLRIHYNAGNKQREQIAVITQAALADLGIQAEVIAEEWNAYLKRVREDKDFEMFVLGWTGGVDPDSSRNIWMTGASQNYVGYSNADVDKWYPEAGSVKGCALQDRAAIYARIQKQIAEDQPYLFLYTNETLAAVNKKIQVNPIGKTGFGGFAYNIEKWQIVPQAQR